MRKIKTAQEIEKGRKRNNLILSVGMALLIGLSSLGYAIMSRDDNTDTTNSAVYAGVKFVKSNGYWITEINSKLFYFTYLPQELENVTIIGNYSFEDYYQQPVYIYNQNPAVGSISYALQDVALRIQEACKENSECTNKDLPIKTCENNMILFGNPNANSTKITKEDNCVYIDGNFFEGADKLVYRMLNIA
jgi:hypothetical protein